MFVTSADPLRDLDPELTYETNFKASVSLDEAARMAGVKRFLFSSSCSTYGASVDKLLDETAEFNPVTPYGRSRILAEPEISRLATDDLSPTLLRNATAYEASSRHRFEIVFNNLAAGLAAEAMKGDVCFHVKHIQRLQEAGQLDASLRWTAHCSANNVAAPEQELHRGIREKEPHFHDLHRDEA
jgi:nucleoside-diphosphate-sugar epimerase